MRERKALVEHWSMPLLVLMISKILFVTQYMCICVPSIFMVLQCLLSIKHVYVMKIAVSYFIIVNFATSNLVCYLISIGLSQIICPSKL